MNPGYGFIYCSLFNQVRFDSSTFKGWPSWACTHYKGLHRISQIKPALHLRDYEIHRGTSNIQLVHVFLKMTMRLHLYRPSFYGLCKISWCCICTVALHHPDNRPGKRLFVEKMSNSIQMLNVAPIKDKPLYNMKLWTGCIWKHPRPYKETDCNITSINNITTKFSLLWSYFLATLQIKHQSIQSCNWCNQKTLGTYIRWDIDVPPPTDMCSGQSLWLQA